MLGNGGGNGGVTGCGVLVSVVVLACWEVVDAIPPSSTTGIIVDGGIVLILAMTRR